MILPNAPGRDAPRRCYVDLRTPAETAIADAVQAVESLDADVRLTNAVVLLGQAALQVADYVDGIARPQETVVEDGWEWAILEVFGHRRHTGRIREEERFGAKLLRIDVPKGGALSDGFTTHYYAGGSIFSLTPTDEATALRANRPYAPPARLTVFDDALDDEDHEVER